MSDTMPTVCHFCGSKVIILSDGSECKADDGRWIGFQCGTSWHRGYHNPRQLQSRPCEIDERDALKARIEQLEDWKQSALAVEREWDANALATMLGGQPGESQREVIQREVPKLLKRIKRLLEAGSAMEWWCCNNEAVFLWRNAKEDKP